MLKEGDDIRTRLQQTALNLFRERGYDLTTAAEIAANTGVTERTFFRYFPDKREVLFGGETVLQSALTDLIAAAPAGLGPLAILFRAFRLVVNLLENNRRFSLPRHCRRGVSPTCRRRSPLALAWLPSSTPPCRGYTTSTLVSAIGSISPRQS